MDRSDSEMPVDRPWSRPPDDVADALDVEPDEGLSGAEVESRRETFGDNKLREAEKRSVLEILVEQFKSLVVVLLVGAAIAALALGHVLDGIAIGVVLVLNTVIGFFTEYQAVRSMEALRELGEIESRVVRGGEEREVHAREIVPGDVVVLGRGDVVPADMRVWEAADIEVDESSLTGESVPVSKSPDPVDGQTPLADRTSMLFRGTVVTRGTARAVVVATGMETELGAISEMVQETEEDRVPLEERLDRLGKMLVWLVIAVAAVVGAAGFLAGRELLLMVETSIALAVAAVPEGLPIVATVALSYGMWRMKQRNALIRNLPSVETLGAATMICTDKTGTLTENQMTVEAFATADRSIFVRREGDEARVVEGEETVDLADDERIRRAVDVAVLANEVSAEVTGASGEGIDVERADPMELALVSLGEEVGHSLGGLLEAYPQVREEPFDTDLNMMGTVQEVDDGYMAAIKGAPEAVVERSTRVFGESDPLDEAGRERLRERADELAEQGYRVLGLATRRVDRPDDELYEELAFVGFVGLLDPPREDVPDALDECHRAGVRTVMMTGDHPSTARNIAEEIGLVQDERAEPLTGRDLEQLSRQTPEERHDRLFDTEVLARVNPQQKLDLIDMLQQEGQVVAVTGDGVNDAPALQSADIGVAMGQRGTDVAREAADMVLLDDAYSTIVEALRQGRVIFENIRKFVVYLLSGNVGEIALVGAAAAVGVPLPLLPLQILYLNVLNDVFPALALGVGPGGGKVMDKPPRSGDAPILEGRDWWDVGFYGLIIAASVGAGFGLALGPLDWSVERAVTVSFLGVSVSRLLHVFNMRDADSGWVDNGITRNVYVWGALGLDFGLLILAVYVAPLAEVLSLTPPGASGWGLVAAMSVVPLVIGQIYLTLRGPRSPDTVDVELPTEV